MPLCIVNIEHYADPKGANNPDDFIQLMPGEVIKAPLGGDMIRAGYLEPIADSDAAEVVTCKCGRMFSGEEHVHFTRAGDEHALFNLREVFGALEGATDEIRELDLKVLKERIAESTAPAEQEALEWALKIKDAEKRVAAEKKRHKPVPKKEAVAA